MREMLTDMIQESVGGCAKNWAEIIADHLLANGVVIIDPQKYPNINNRRVIKTVLGVPLDEMAELIDAKQEGRIIVLPCKVGDTTYIFDYEINNYLETKIRGIIPSIVEAITIVDDGLWIENEHAKYQMCAIGDLLFLTKEEAEEALAKMKGGAET